VLVVLYSRVSDDALEVLVDEARGDRGGLDTDHLPFERRLQSVDRLERAVLLAFQRERPFPCSGSAVTEADLSTASSGRSCRRAPKRDTSARFAVANMPAMMASNLPA